MKVTPPIDRLLSHIVITSGPLASDCWVSTYSNSSAGYAKIQTAGRNYWCHRLSYELLVGPIPDGLQLDHLCRNRRCINPAHLEPVTAQVNFLRGMAVSAITTRTGTCKRGHSMSDAYVGSGCRECRTCKTWRNRRRSNPGLAVGPGRDPLLAGEMPLHDWSRS